MISDDFGEIRAYFAAEEAPLCWVCDKAINDLRRLRHTVRGKPLCEDCADDIDLRVHRAVAGLPGDLAALLKREAQ